LGGEAGKPQEDVTLRLGQIALDRGLISPEQLYDALEAQTKGLQPGEPRRPLPEILLEKGYLKDHQLTMLVEQEKSAPRSSPLRALSTFGKYDLLRELGKGGMGVVYEARDQELGRKVALKMLLSSPNASDEELQPEIDRFLVEAKLTAKLPKHPNVVSVYEAGIIDGKRYLAMELIEGQSYSKLRKSGPVPLNRQIEILRDVALAVHHAHQQGVVHRDLKPDNILLDAREQPHVMDFGLAKSVGQDVSLSLTATGMVIGTPSYMSPEQALGLKSTDHRTDLYALGVMLYETLTGQPPFTGDTAIEILLKASKNPVPPPSSILKNGISPGVDKTLEKICLKCLAKKPKDRYDSAETLARDLTSWLKGEAVQVKVVREPLAERISPIWVLAGLAGSLLLILGWAFFVTPRGNAEIERLRKERDQAREEAARSAPPSVVGLPAEEQVRRVVARLQELNPGYDGREQHQVEGNRVVRLTLSSAAIHDLSPLRSLSQLEHLSVAGTSDKATQKSRGLLTDLAPLKGLPLKELIVSINPGLRDLSPLRGMKLERLQCMTTDVSDLRPLAGMPLVLLYVDDTPLASLAELQGLPLEELDVAYTKVSDLAPLRGLPLERLNLAHTKVADLSPLRGMKLRSLDVRATLVKDLSLLPSFPLEKINGKPAAEFQGR